MTVFQHRWRRSAALAATGAAALVGTGILAVPASAHTPNWSVDCSSVSVDLTRYSTKVTNTVTIEAGGEDVLPTQKFGQSFEKTLELPEHSTDLTVRLIVKAGDGEKYSVDQTKISRVCEGSPEPTPSSTPPSTPPPSESASPTPSETATSEAPAAEPQGNSPAPTDLAETGSSSATPMIAGVAGAVVLAGAGLLVVSRRRRSTQH